MTFCRFGGGKRICAGKTFAETIMRFIIPGIMGKFEF